MKAIILSAGMGTRVGNHTAVTPKCMLDILGTNILEIQVKQLKMMGINDIFVIGGHYAHKINNPYKGPKNVSIPTLLRVLAVISGKNF